MTWKRGSSILTELPRPTITAIPWATHHIPRVAMKEGMRAAVERRPPARPASAPIPTAMGSTQKPRS